jgi:hypothetical protein
VLVEEGGGGRGWTVRAGPNKQIRSSRAGLPASAEFFPAHVNSAVDLYPQAFETFCRIRTGNSRFLIRI